MKKLIKQKRITLILLPIAIIILYIFFNSFYLEKNIKITGFTMGTYYEITLLHSSQDMSSVVLKKDIDQLLKNYNLIVSPFEKNSEISKFNNHNNTNPIKVSTELYKLIKYSHSISAKSAGLFDPTIAPLINLWGFGVNGKKNKPSENEINNAKKRIGYKNIKILPNNTLKKIIPSITLNLSAFAKGYGVDMIADYLKQKGFKQGFVNIGGEIVTFGTRDDNKEWRIAIDTPKYGGGNGEYFKIIKLSDNAIATSGDYRNYFKKQNQVYSHIINPKTGYPVNNNIASVSVIAKNCKEADMLATTLMLLNVEAGLKLIEEIKDCEALFILRENGAFKEKKSSGFKKYIFFLQ